MSSIVSLTPGHLDNIMNFRMADHLTFSSKTPPFSLTMALSSVGNHGISWWFKFCKLN